MFHRIEKLKSLAKSLGSYSVRASNEMVFVDIPLPVFITEPGTLKTLAEMVIACDTVILSSTGKNAEFTFVIKIKEND